MSRPSFTEPELVKICQILTHPDIVGLTNEQLSSATMATIYLTLAVDEGSFDNVDLTDVRSGSTENAEPTPGPEEIAGPPAEVAKKLRANCEASPVQTTPDSEALLSSARARADRIAKKAGSGASSALIELMLSQGFTFSEEPLSCSNAAFNKGNRKVFKKFEGRDLRRWCAARTAMLCEPDKSLLKDLHRNVLHTLLGYLGLGGAHTSNWPKDVCVNVCYDELLETRKNDRMARMAEATTGPRKRDHERAQEAGYTAPV